VLVYLLHHTICSNRLICGVIFVLELGSAEAADSTLAQSDSVVYMLNWRE
jgi:hypothetical protein